MFQYLCVFFPNCNARNVNIHFSVFVLFCEHSCWKLFIKVCVFSGKYAYFDKYVNVERSSKFSMRVAKL